MTFGLRENREAHKMKNLSIKCTAVGLAIITALPLTAAQAYRKKKYTPGVVTSAVHDGQPTPQPVSTNFGREIFPGGMTGVTTEEQGVTVTQSPPGFYKKVEVQAMINKGVEYSYNFGWYQQYEALTTSNVPLFSENTNGQYIWDTGSGHAPGSYNSDACTHSVDGSRILYLYDAPGVPTSLANNAAGPMYYASNVASYRDSVKYIAPDNSSKDIVAGQWLPSWAQNQKLHKDSGSVNWYATQNY
jgi:hypothetical protein